MSLIAICPACNTHFSVVPDQLKISEGWVRCGNCHEVFDAIVHSSSESNETFCMPLESDSPKAQAPAPSYAEPQHRSATAHPAEAITTAPAPFTPPTHTTRTPLPTAAGQIGQNDSPTTTTGADTPNIDTDIDSTSPYMSVGDVLDSITANQAEEEARIGFVQRWLHGRQSQHAPLDATASSYPTIEAKESQQQELAHRKSLERPEQRIQSVLSTLDAISKQQPSPAEKPTYADPQTQTQTPQPTQASAATHRTPPTHNTSPAPLHALGTDTLRAKLEHLEPSLQVRETFPWSPPTSSDQPNATPQTVPTPPPPPDSATPFAASAASWDELDTRPPASHYGASVLPEQETHTDAASSDFTRSLQSRAMRVHAAQPTTTSGSRWTDSRFHNSDFDDGDHNAGSTLPSKLADERDPPLSEKIGAVQVHAKSTTHANAQNAKASDQSAGNKAGNKADHTNTQHDTARPTEKEPAFVRAAKRTAFWQSTPLRILGYTSCLLAAMALLLQYTHFHRNRLAVQFPAMRPALQQMCDLSGCQLAAWRHIQAVHVESSDFTLTAGGQRYRMALGLRNHSHLAVAAPWIELTLTDSQNRPIVRRPFSPYELGIKAVQFQPDTVYEGDVLIDIDADVLDPRYISGYSVLAFYP